MNWQPPQKFERGTKPQNSTETALFYTACYGFVLCLVTNLKNINTMKKKFLFKGKLVGKDEWVHGTYHYSNDGNYHYILNRECFLERTYDSGNEMALKKEEVHLVEADSVIQVDSEVS